MQIAGGRLPCRGFAPLGKAPRIHRLKPVVTKEHAMNMRLPSVAAFACLAEIDTVSAQRFGSPMRQSQRSEFRNLRELAGLTLEEYTCFSLCPIPL